MTSKIATVLVLGIASPLTPKVGANVQDQWAPSLYDSDDWTNSLLLRSVIPVGAGAGIQVFAGLNLQYPWADDHEAPSVSG